MFLVPKINIKHTFLKKEANKVFLINITTIQNILMNTIILSKNII